MVDITRVLAVSAALFAAGLGLSVADEPLVAVPQRNVQIDPAFVPFVDVLLLGDAWAEHDASLLTDLGLQLAAAEQVLLRSHPSISSDDLFRIAIGTAVEYQDLKSLIRLEKAVANRSQELKDLVTQGSLAAQSRDISSGPSIAIDGISIDDFEVFKFLQKHIRSARITQDQNWTDAIAAVLRSMSDLDPTLVAHLDEMLASSRSLNPSPEEGTPGGTVFNPTSDILVQLEAASRGRRMSQSGSNAGNRFLGNFNMQFGRSPHIPRRQSNSGAGRILGQIDLGGGRGHHGFTDRNEGFPPRGGGSGGFDLSIIPQIIEGIDQIRDRHGDRNPEFNPPPVRRWPEHHHQIVRPQPQPVPQMHIVRPQPQVIRQRPVVRPPVSVRANSIPRKKPPVARANAAPHFASFDPIDAASQQLAADLVHEQTGKAITDLEDQLGDAAADPDVQRKLEELRAKAENGEAVTEDDLVELTNLVDPGKLPPGFNPNDFDDAAIDVLNLSEANELLQQQVFPGGGFNGGFPMGPVLTMPALPQDMQFIMPDGCVMMGTGGEGQIEVVDDGMHELLDMNVGIGEPELETTEEAITGGIVLRNPEDNGGEVSYYISGANHTLQPGEDRRISGSQSRQIRFDAGDGSGELKFTLSQGTYVFRQSGLDGWKLLRQSFEVTLDNSKNDDDFYFNIDGRQEQIAGGRRQTFSSDYPITVMFDRGDGDTPARKQVDDRETTLVVAVNSADGLWDLYPAQNFSVAASKSSKGEKALRQAMLKERLKSALKQSQPTILDSGTLFDTNTLDGF